MHPQRNKISKSIRSYFILSLLLSCISLIGVLFLENIFQLTPCPLCMIQRICLITIILVCFIAIVHHPKKYGYSIYSILLLLIIFTGSIVAARQIWLQQQPPGSVTSCGADIKFMFQNLPFTDFLGYLFKGTADCAEVQWNFLYISLPGWSIILFVCLAVIQVTQIIRNIKSLLSKKQ
jgi:protein dithiol:quinone oxidoreductase